MKTVSYAITVCNELEEIVRLLNLLQQKINTDDEIVVQYDDGNTPSEVIDYLEIQSKVLNNFKYVGFPLNNDFASFKNNLIKICSKDYIFQIDADEYPHEYLLENINQVLTENSVDIIFVPRVNTVDGLTDAHIQKWKWRVDDRGWVNWPDYQSRIYANNGQVQWMNKVHETLTNFDTFTRFPAIEEYSLYHPKEIERQERQNDYYNKL